MHETFKATVFNIEQLEEGMQIKIRAPINGAIKIKIRTFIEFNNKTSNINILQDLNLRESAQRAVAQPTERKMP